jgi:hypothetical protein
MRTPKVRLPLPESPTLGAAAPSAALGHHRPRRRTTAWKPSSGCFVKRDQHAVAVPPASIAPHTYPPPPRVVVDVPRSRCREGSYLAPEDVPMHSLGYELPRTRLLGNPVNRQGLGSRTTKRTGTLKPRPAATGLRNPPRRTRRLA